MLPLCSRIWTHTVLHYLLYRSRAYARVKFCDCLDVPSSEQLLSNSGFYLYESLLCVFGTVTVVENRLIFNKITDIFHTLESKVKSGLPEDFFQAQKVGTDLPFKLTTNTHTEGLRYQLVSYIHIILSTRALSAQLHGTTNLRIPID